VDKPKGSSRNLREFQGAGSTGNGGEWMGNGNCVRRGGKALLGKRGRAKVGFVSLVWREMELKGQTGKEHRVLGVK